MWTTFCKFYKIRKKTYVNKISTHLYLDNFQKSYSICTLYKSEDN